MKKRYLTNRIGVIATLILVAGSAMSCVFGSHEEQAISSAKNSRDDISEETSPMPEKLRIRTTAYTHTESDHVAYGRKSAAGTELRHGRVNSAAADWSRFPLGTKFKISGSDVVYEIDDYGSALVGKDVIDLYCPSRGEMNEWGAREVEIEIIDWGCRDRSLEIIKPRSGKAPHIDKMVEALENSDSDHEGGGDRSDV